MERRPSPLDNLVAELQQRYGSRAAGGAMCCRRGRHLLFCRRACPRSTWRLAAGCRGRLRELVGPRSAGATTLALTAVAQAQR